MAFCCYESSAAGYRDVHDRAPARFDRAWVPARDPIHFDKPNLVGDGPGLTFGKVMARQSSDVRIGLIPCAVGGSSIDVWTTGAVHESTGIYPYDAMLERVRIARKSGELKGILWHQGEADSEKEAARAYQDKLIDFMQRLQEDLDAPNVPIVVGKLAPFFVGNHPGARTVNQALEQLPEHVENTAWVSAEGLQDKGDAVHFSAEAARELGHRYAETMQQLQDITYQ